jgi:nucleoside-diphosphate-sugar epimerase
MNIRQTDRRRSRSNTPPDACGQEVPAAKIVVTGAAGYIGAAVVALLLEAGHTVAGLDCLRFGGSALLGSYLTGRFTLGRGDIRDRGLVARVLQGADAVVHLAGIVGDPACAAEPALARAVNLDATVALHEAARKAGVGRFVFASTCSVYGHCGQPAGETAPLHPLSLYAQTKADGETALLGAAADSMATTVLRFATVYGLAPRMRFDLVVNAFVAQALTTGRVQVFTPAAWRPLIHVADVAGAVTSVVQAPASAVSGRVFNAGSADNWQLADVARLVAEICGPGVQVDITPARGDLRDYRISTGKLAAATGWTARRSLRGGIGELAGALSAGVLDGHPAIGGSRAA